MEPQSFTDSDEDLSARGEGLKPVRLVGESRMYWSEAEGRWVQNMRVPDPPPPMKVQARPKNSEKREIGDDHRPPAKNRGHQRHVSSSAHSSPLANSSSPISSSSGSPYRAPPPPPPPATTPTTSAAQQTFGAMLRMPSLKNLSATFSSKPPNNLLTAQQSNATSSTFSTPPVAPPNNYRLSSFFSSGTGSHITNNNPPTTTSSHHSSPNYNYAVDHNNTVHNVIHSGVTSGTMHQHHTSETVEQNKREKDRKRIRSTPALPKIDWQHAYSSASIPGTAQGRPGSTIIGSGNLSTMTMNTAPQPPPPPKVSPVTDPRLNPKLRPGSGGYAPPTVPGKKPGVSPLQPRAKKFANEPEEDKKDAKKPRSPRDREKTPPSFANELRFEEKKKRLDPLEIEKLRREKEIKRELEQMKKIKRLKKEMREKDLNAMTADNLKDLKDRMETDYWKRMRKLRKKERQLERQRLNARGEGKKDPSPRIRKDGLTIEFPANKVENEAWTNGEGITVPATAVPLPEDGTAHQGTEQNGSTPTSPTSTTTNTTTADEKTDTSTEAITEENVPVSHDDEEEKQELVPRSPRRDPSHMHKYWASVSADRKSPRLLKREFYTSAPLSLSTPSALPPPPPPPPYPNGPSLQSTELITTYKEKKKGHYEGNFHPVHKKHGIGKYTYSNGDVYEGEWVDDRREGYGTMTYATGEKYQGVWLNDRKEGRGSCAWLNNDSFEGNWLNDKRHGQGTYKQASGTEYLCYWVDDKPHNVGVLKDKTEEYKGEVLCVPCGTKYMRHQPYQIIRHGQGTVTTAVGNRYFGCWKKGVRDSFGVEFKKNGEKYYGSWRNDKPHGYGLWIHGDNTQYFGEFERGEPFGKGEMRFPNGDTLLGVWQKNTLVKALCTKNDPKVTQKGAKWCIMVDPHLLLTSIEIEQLQRLSQRDHLHDHSIGRLLDYFIDLFTWSYPLNLFTKSKKQKETLADAIADVNSFIEYLVNNISIMEASNEKRKKLKEVLCVYILNNIYHILRPMYLQVYKEQDSKLALKIKSLENANLTELGVRDLFHLIYPKPDKWIDKEKLTKYEEEKKAKLEQIEAEEKAKREENGGEASPTILRRKASVETLLLSDEEKGKLPPYWEGIELLETLSSVSAVAKLDCLLAVARSIVKSVADYWACGPDNIDTTMGAAEKLPVFQYVMVKAKVKNLFSEFSFIKDFQQLQVFQEENGELEGKYRLSELEAALEYLMTLDARVKDRENILIPTEMLKKNASEIMSYYRDENVAHYEVKIDWLVDILMAINNRTETPYADLILNQRQRKLVTQENVVWMKRIFYFLGMVLFVKFVSKNTKERLVGISFELKYPLYVYMEVAEGLWESKISKS